MLLRALDKTNNIPAWSAFQSVTTDYPTLCEVNVGYMPPIHDTPTKYDVILEILSSAEKCRNELDLEYIFLEADQAVYHKVLDVKFQLPEQFKNVIVRMGGFHLIMCLMRSVYSRFRGFGLVELLAEVGDLGGPGTIESSLKGSDVKFGIRLYKLLFEAFYRIKLKMLEKRCLTSESRESIKLRELVECTDISNDIIDPSSDYVMPHYSAGLKYLSTQPTLTKILNIRTGGDMAFWIDSFLEMVHLLLNVIHFQRCGNWDGLLETMFDFLPYCFGLNRNKYARNLSYFYLDMLKLPEIFPEAYAYLQQGGFSGSLSGKSHSNIPMDQMIECTINRFSKSVGGIVGRTEDKAACEKWGRLSPYLCALKEHLDKKMGNQREADLHIEFGKSRFAKDKRNVEAIVNITEAWVPDIFSDKQPLINIGSGSIASDELISNVKSMLTRGKVARDSFFERLYTSTKDESVDSDYYGTIKRELQKTFADKTKPSQKMNILEDEGQSFSDVLSRYDNKVLDYTFLMSWPVTSRPWAICNEEEQSRVVKKHLHRNYLQTLNPTKAIQGTIFVPICIVDAMKILYSIQINKLKPPIYKTWATKVFDNMKNIPCNSLHIIFDVYPSEIDLSAPSKTRYNPDKIGDRRYVSDLSQRLPSTQLAWTSYLSNDQNKCELTNLLIDFVLTGEYVFNKPVHITSGGKCYSKNPDDEFIEVPELETKLKEADPRLALHAIHVSKIYPNESICVVSDDTDVFIILLSIALHINGTLLFRQGTSSRLEYHNVSSLAAHLGDKCCRNLPAFHALTGCDFTFTFYGRTKNRAFNLMINKNNAKRRSTTFHLLDSLGSDNPNLEDITKFILQTIYNRPLREKTPTDSRVAMLRIAQKGKTKKVKYRSTKAIPPDSKSMNMKIRRANKIAYSWNWVNFLNPNFHPLDARNEGWEVKEFSNNEKRLVPIWYTGNPLPTDEEYDEHILTKYKSTDKSDVENVSEDSESDSESDQYANSESDSSSDDDLNN